MFCRRCGLNPPDFIWTGYDHPILLDHPMTMQLHDLPGSENKVKVIAEIYVERRLCSDVYPIEEIVIIDEKLCVIIHLAENAENIIEIPPPGLYITACSGKYARFLGQNDTRPTVMCEKCKTRSTKGE